MSTIKFSSFYLAKFRLKYRTKILFFCKMQKNYLSNPRIRHKMINSAVCDKFEKKEHGIIFNDDAKIFTVTEFSFFTFIIIFVFFNLFQP